MVQKTMILVAAKHKEWLEIVLSFGCKKEVAEDLVQEMYIKIQLKLEKGLDIMYNDKEINYYYIFKTLRTLFYDLKRKGKNITMVSIDDIHLTTKYVNFVPSHPIAGLEKSGPEFGFAKIFENRFCIITPIDSSLESVDKIKMLWRSIGMQIEIMNAEHHDRVLAMTSHIPQLIAYSIVATATDLESHLKDEVLKYSAAGFRDFTRLAGSDPIMWRDIYSKNKDAVLEMLGRFTEDLSTLQKAIRNDNLSFLEKTFDETREVRKEIEKLGQAGSFDPRESKKIK